MTDREFRKELEVILDGWPFVRSHLFAIISSRRAVSSRRLELVDEIIYDTHAAITDRSNHEG